MLKSIQQNATVQPIGSMMETVKSRTNNDGNRNEQTKLNKGPKQKETQQKHTPRQNISNSINNPFLYTEIVLNAVCSNSPPTIMLQKQTQRGAGGYIKTMKSYASKWKSKKI